MAGMALRGVSRFLQEFALREAQAREDERNQQTRFLTDRAQEAWRLGETSRLNREARDYEESLPSSEARTRYNQASAARMERELDPLGGAANVGQYVDQTMDAAGNERRRLLDDARALREEAGDEKTEGQRLLEEERLYSEYADLYFAQDADTVLRSGAHLSDTNTWKGLQKLRPKADAAGDAQMQQMLGGAPMGAPSPQVSVPTFREWKRSRSSSKSGPSSSSVPSWPGESPVYADVSPLPPPGEGAPPEAPTYAGSTPLGMSAAAAESDPVVVSQGERGYVNATDMAADYLRRAGNMGGRFENGRYIGSQTFDERLDTSRVGGLEVDGAVRALMTKKNPATGRAFTRQEAEAEVRKRL